jgi:nucleoside triphosphate pyrophosphatase
VRIVLASASPRRAELLTSAGFEFERRPADVDETRHAGETPEVYALRVARLKARAIGTASEIHASPILAADTVVIADGRILGKPRDREDARDMLKSLSGRIHEVLTAVVVRVGEREFSDVVTTRVRVLLLTDAEIASYIASGEPEGKAGAYAIQGRAARYIDWIEGSWSNVVGLPIATVHRLLTAAGEAD